MSWSPVDTVTLRSGQYATHIDGEETRAADFFFLIWATAAAVGRVHWFDELLRLKIFCLPRRCPTQNGKKIEKVSVNMSSMPRLTLITERVLTNVKVDEENRQAERVNVLLLYHFTLLCRPNELVLRCVKKFLFYAMRNAGPHLYFMGFCIQYWKKKTVEKTDNNTHCSLDILTFEFRSQFWMTSVALAPCFYPQLQQGDQRRTGNTATLISASVLLLFLFKWRLRLMGIVVFTVSRYGKLPRKQDFTESKLK